MTGVQERNAEADRILSNNQAAMDKVSSANTRFVRRLILSAIKDGTRERYQTEKTRKLSAVATSTNIIQRDYDVGLAVATRLYSERLIMDYGLKAEPAIAIAKAAFDAGWALQERISTALDRSP